MKLIIFGAPGAGKGTISEMLSKEYHLKHISMGEIIRQEIEHKTELGNELKSITEKGHLVSDDIIERLLRKVMPDSHVLLDGMPRTVNQKKLLDEFFQPDHVIFINTSKEEIISRLSSRLECPKCGAIYGRDVKPKKEGYCDKDNVKLERRSDDDPKVIATRFKVYEDQTKPVLALYKGKVMTINGDQKPEAIFRDIQKLLK